MITINITKAKDIAHNIRRAARTEEFKPYDDAIAKQIPGKTEESELARQVIRQKYAVMQTTIEAAITVDELKSALST